MAWYSTKRATTVTEINGMQACVYHSTPVVSWDAERIILKSGGHQTVTTKRRMNEVSDEHGLGFRVWQKDFEWFVTLPHPAPYPSPEHEGIDLLQRFESGKPREHETIPFTEGMVILRKRPARAYSPPHGARGRVAP